MNKLEECGFKTTYSAKDNILESLFKKVFTRFKVVNICTSYFSSQALELLYDEIKYLYENDGTFNLILGVGTAPGELDKMKLLSEDDEWEYIVETLFDNVYADTVEKYRIIREFIMSGRFTIKVGKSDNGAIFHNKLYIFTDNEVGEFGIAAYGSMNFTRSGLLDNYETLALRESYESYFESVEEFNSLWSNSYKGTTVNSIKDQVIEALDERISIHEKIVIAENKKLYDFQEEAIRKLEENNYSGILEMATGTGKTFTALCTLDKMFFEENLAKRANIIVPYKHLADQWESEIKNYFGERVNVVQCHSDNSQWLNEIRLYAPMSTKNIFIFVEKSFYNNHENTIISNPESILLVDEVHNITTEKFERVFSKLEYKYRIALSATPEDEFEKERTLNLLKYFDGIVFKYTLEEAIENGFLTKYYYFPEIVELTNDEIDEYDKIQTQIRESKLRGYKNILALEEDKADILSQAEKKIEKFKEKLEEVDKESGIKNTLVYCAPGKFRRNKDMKFIDKITNEIHSISTALNVNQITSQEPTDKRRILATKFKNRELDILCAIKCLDEGYNIPSIERAFILYSTVRTREYIQRRGRLLRTAEGKEYAIIHDFVVKVDGKFDILEKKRLIEYSRLAVNYKDVKELYERENNE